jgi:glycosyltransferase involved in cell wall biosynthesis
MSSKRIVMVGTHLETMGGISSVVGVYQDAGLFERHPIEYLVSHRDGGSFLKARTALRAWSRLMGLLVGRKVELLHVHMSHRASCWRKLCFLWPAIAMGVPVIIHLHGSEFAEFFDRECSPRRQRLIRSTFDRAARVIVLSESWRRWVRGMCGNPQVITLHNPVSVPPATPESAPERQAGSMLFLGRLGRRKGTYDLLDALGQIDGQGNALQLWLCGDGEVEACREAAAKLGIADKVQFLGWVRGDEKEQLLKTASVYVLPSYREGLPMSVLEAMAAGLPVVSTRIGGIPEAVTDGVEGFLIDAGDTAALTDRLQLLTSAPQQAARMGRAARARVEAEFSAHVIVPRLEAMYADVVRES